MKHSLFFCVRLKAKHSHQQQQQQKSAQTKLKESVSSRFIGVFYKYPFLYVTNWILSIFICLLHSLGLRLVFIIIMNNKYRWCYYDFHCMSALLIIQLKLKLNDQWNLNANCNAIIISLIRFFCVFLHWNGFIVEWKPILANDNQWISE